MSNFSNITDENLFQLCRVYGARAVEWRNKFIGLLPEVNRRKLYKKKGFDSIIEFAAKLAGVSKNQLGTVLHLEERFEDKPLLKKLLVTGEVSINKLVRVASIATSENEQFLAAQVQLLPKSALETLVRDEKYFKKNAQKSSENLLPIKNQDGLFQDQKELKSLPGQELNFSEEVKTKLFELQQKGININDLLLQFLEKREQEIFQEKQQITKAMNEKVEEQSHENQSEKATEAPYKIQQKKPSRYIAAKIRRILTKEHGDKCSIPNCQKNSQEIHHTQRFGLAAQQTLATIHAPQYLAPLCKNHHQIAHSIDIQYHEVRQKVVTAPLQSRLHYSY